MSDLETAKKYFSDIAQKFPPVNLSSLPDAAKQLLSPDLTSQIPVLSQWQVLKLLKESKITDSSVRGDLPSSLRRAVQVELAVPLTIIFNNCIASSDWPNMWKLEYGTPLPKTNQPASQDEVCIISVTHAASKCFEKQVLYWLKEHIL